MAKAKTAAKRPAPAISSPYTKSQLLSSISESTGLSKKDVGAVIDELSIVINRHLKKRSAGEFTLPGLLKVKTVKKPATKSRKMISPFTGEEITVSAKPARTAVKVMPLKGLKTMVE